MSEVLTVGSMLEMAEVAATLGMHRTAAVGLIEPRPAMIPYKLSEELLMYSPEPKHHRVAKVPAGHERTAKDRAKRKAAKRARRTNKRNRRK